MSLSPLPISSPSYISIISSTPLSPPTFPLNHSHPCFLYPPHPHGQIISAAFSLFKPTNRPASASMKTGPSRFLSLSSCSAFRAAEFDSASDGDEDDECADEEEERVVVVHGDEGDEDADGASGPSLFPERWDVLGLGQAMVISNYFFHFLSLLIVGAEKDIYFICLFHFLMPDE